MDRQQKTGGSRNAVDGFSKAHDPQFAAELQRRLDILESTGYEDPARRDLPTLDYVLLAALVIVTVIVAYVWGY